MRCSSIIRFSGFKILTFSLIACHCHADWYGALTYSGSDAELINDKPRGLLIDEDNRDSGWQLSSGYQFNRHFSLEMGYADYGSHSATISVDPAVIQAIVADLNFAPVFNPNEFLDGSPLTRTDVIVNAVPFDSFVPPNSKVETSTRGVRLAALGNFPISSRLAFSFQGGMFYSRYRTTYYNQVAAPQLNFSRDLNFVNDGSTTGFIDANIGTGGAFGTIAPLFLRFTEFRVTNTSRELEFFGGIGMQFSFNDSISTKLFWERIFNLGDDRTLEQDMDSYNLSLILNF